MKLKLGMIICLLFVVSFLAHASGNNEEAFADTLSGGIELYDKGQLSEAAEQFGLAAASENPETAAAGHYNQGSVQAELAQQTNDVEKKRGLLEKSFESLKRATEIGGLPPEQLVNARRNMEIVREELSRLPEEAPQQSNKDDSRQDGRKEQQNNQGAQSGDSDASSGQNGQNGQGGQDPRDAQSPGTLLQKQKELSDRTQNGTDNPEQLAAEQKELQKASGNSGFDEAADNQARAAEALEKGNSNEALNFQKAAEKALSDAADAEDDTGVEEILSEEAERNADRNRLDRRGGITDADRNW